MDPIKPRTPLRFAILLYVVLIANGYSATNEAEHAKYPETLTKAVEAFKLASPTNRYNEAVALVKELPKCALKSERDVGTGIYRSYDFDRPSYILTSEGTIRLLGKPLIAQTNAGEVSY